MTAVSCLCCGGAADPASGARHGARESLVATTLSSSLQEHKHQAQHRDITVRGAVRDSERQWRAGTVIAVYSVSQLQGEVKLQVDYGVRFSGYIILTSQSLKHSRQITRYSNQLPSSYTMRTTMTML